MLTDLVLRAENGRAVDRIAEQFNLSRDQTVDAIEALMPAFSTGLQRNTRTAGGQASLLQALGSGRHPQYVEEPERAFSPEGQAEGRGILGHVFGNPDVSRGVAAQAAQRTGLSEGLLKKLLPVLAPIVMGALVKGLTGRSGQGRSGGGSLGRSIGDAAGGGLLGSILGSLADGFLSGARSGARPTRRAPTSTRRRARRRSSRSGGLEDLIGDLVGGAFGGDEQPAPRKRSATTRRRAPKADLDRIFAPRPRSQPRTRRPARRSRGDDLFGQALEPGGRTDAGYRREVGSVFDQLLGE